MSRNKNEMFSMRNENLNSKNEFNPEEDTYNIKIFRRTLENNTHEVLEDTKIKKVTSWRKSQKKFFISLIFNILSLGIIHLLSLYFPSLYIKLYCIRRKPQECDYFLVENTYGNLTLCKKIYKKDKTQNNNINLSSENHNETMISSSSANNNNKLRKNLTKNLTYSFKYRSVTYEYDEINNEIIPVYINLSNYSCKDIFNYFSDGLSSEKIIKIFFNRYGKNEYNLNFKMIYLYFLGVELPHLIFVVIISLIELYLSDYISFIAKITIIIILLIVEFVNIKITIYDSYKREFTLDGEKNKIRVKRNHILDKKTDLFSTIDNCDLLPGDIIFLKSNDTVPCDCLILEGECVVNSNNLTGNLNIFLKVPLKNKNIPFNYKLNKDNILYHGMKIVKTYSNLKQEYISALCINTGPNTYKANQYSNTIYLFERKKEYLNIYRFFGKENVSIIYVMIAVFITAIIVGTIFLFLIMHNESDILNFKDKNKLILFLIILARVVCKSFMPMYFLIKSIIILNGIFSLKRNNIYTFEKTKLLCSGDIDTLFISKTGTLCEEKFEINGFHPVSVGHHNINSLGFKFYSLDQNKEINMQLVEYYKDYLNNKNKIGYFGYKNDRRNDNNKLNPEKIKNKSFEYSTLFLECLLCCNNLEKFGMEIFGNSIDSEIFKAMKWDIKSDNNYSNINFDIEYSDNRSNNINLKEKIISDIFPTNYYKITESNKIENDNSFGNKTELKTVEEITEHRDSLLSNNYLENDILKSHIDSYKLRIYKRYIRNGAFSSSSISYNFLTKELRFNTKGIPEEIIDKCNVSTIPENFDKVISSYRRKGFIVIICASKKISMEFYNDSDTEEKYMNDLTFYGFITLKNNLKKEVNYAINGLRLFDINFIINTGDDLFNTLPVGFESTILENKDIYSFDKDEIKNRIVIKKIYSVNINEDNKVEEENNYNQINESPLFDKFTKVSRNNYTFKSQKMNLKLSKILSASNPANSLLITDKKLGQFTLDGNNNKIKEQTTKTKKFKNNLNDGSFSSSKDILNKSIKNSIRASNKQSLKKFFSKKNIVSLNASRKPSNISNITSDEAAFCGNNDKNEILYYYPGIFEDRKELTEDCIYCVNSNVFEFLYQNKTKKQSKILLDLIHQKCRIFYNMNSLSKSKVIDYYREYPNNCICTIGESQSDIDSIISSNIGINLQAPKNFNTILSHFYSPDADLLIIDKIIRKGRSIKENSLLMNISCSLYTLILNSYIICCFIRERDIIQGQLNLMEIAFLFFSISAFTAEVDDSKDCNSLFQNRKLYICHYIFQIAGLIIIKALGIYFHSYIYNTNDFLERKQLDVIYSTYYFIYAFEQLFSTIFVLNLINFYRTSWVLNTKFIIITIILLLYFVSIITLTDSNYNVDIFKILYFEFLDNIVDAYDENNKIGCFLICLIDFCFSLLYSRIIFYIFSGLSMKNQINKNSN